MKKSEIIKEQFIRKIIREEIKRLDEKNRFTGSIEKLIKKGAISDDHWLAKAKTSGEKVEIYKDVITWIKGAFEGVWDGNARSSVEDGKFKNTIFKNGNIYNGSFDNVTHLDGQVFGGNWKNVKWKGGTWPGGRGTGKPIALA